MPNAAVAEWVLALVTEPDRAAAVAGDLLEEAPVRGAWWFWGHVLRTALSHVLRDLRSWSMIWLGLFGLLETYALAVILLNSAFRIWMALWPYQISPNSVYVSPRAYFMIGAVVMAIVPFAAGWGVARVSKGHELAAGLAAICSLAVLQAATAYSTGTLVQHVEGPYPHDINGIIAIGLGDAGILTGALCRRLLSNWNRKHFPYYFPRSRSPWMALVAVAILALAAINFLSVR